MSSYIVCDIIFLIFLFMASILYITVQATKLDQAITYLYYFGVMLMKFGFGSAIGVVIFLICFTIALTYQRTLMRKD